MTIQSEGPLLADIKAGHVILIGGGNLCKTGEELILSDVFKRVLWRYLRRLDHYKSPLLDCVKSFQTSELSNGHIKERYDLKKLVSLFYTLYSGGLEASVQDPSFAKTLENPLLFGDFLEEFYNFWRRQERFLLYQEAQNGKESLAERDLRFMNINQELKNLVLSVYRKLSILVTKQQAMVYRQLPAGVAAGLLLENISWDLPEQGYFELEKIPFLQLAVLEPPLVYYPKRNTRKGQFVKLTENPLCDGLIKDPNHWVSFPLKVGDLLIFVYFHIDFLSLGVSLVNLFELATKEEIEGKRPAAIVAFGVDGELIGSKQTVYYKDEANNLTVGLIGHSDEVDYFGYFKKMILTLHNSIMLEQGHLPVHGAMANVVLRNGESFNVVIVGDSGAGKSESLEAFRILADEYISRLTIIFDDMGSLRVEDGLVKGYGTEIGAFVRLDDLEPGYAYEEIDRSIFMNPHRTNARLVVPITDYREICRGYPVDLFLYANNYSEVLAETDYLEFFKSEEEAFQVFRRGARYSKGTTDEFGLVETYFANPFGASQAIEIHDPLAKAFFAQMFASNVLVGELKTQLGISGKEMSGPEEAAKALFNFVNAKSK